MQKKKTKLVATAAVKNSISQDTTKSQIKVYDSDKNNKHMCVKTERNTRNGDDGDDVFGTATINSSGATRRGRKVER